MDDYIDEIMMVAPCNEEVDTKEFYVKLAQAFKCNLRVIKNNEQIFSTPFDIDLVNAELVYEDIDPNVKCIFELGEQALLFHKDFIEIAHPFQVGFDDIRDAHYKNTLVEDNYFNALWESLKLLQIFEIHVNSFEELSLHTRDKQDWATLKSKLIATTKHFTIKL